MADTGKERSARENELLEAAYRYVLDHGITDLSLRPLAAEIGSSPRVLMFLFTNKDGLVRAILARARVDELALLARLRGEDGPVGLDMAVERTWAWLVAVEHRALLRVWAESYARSLVEPTGPWAGFAQRTVEDWMKVLADAQPETERTSTDGAAARVLALAVLRGTLLHLLATDDEATTTSAIAHHVAQLRTTATATDPTVHN